MSNLNVVYVDLKQTGKWGEDNQDQQIIALTTNVQALKATSAKGGSGHINGGGGHTKGKNQKTSNGGDKEWKVPAIRVDYQGGQGCAPKWQVTKQGPYILHPIKK